MVTHKPRRRNQGVTLIEMMLTLGLVVMVYMMMTTILVQIARYVKDGRQVAAARHDFLKEVETLRYQLRTLYYPPGNGTGLLGERTSLNGRDTLRFYTSFGRNHRGIVEVGYKLDTFQDEHGQDVVALYYREFPFRRGEMRSLEEYEEGPWTMILDRVDLLSFEYSSSGRELQKEWEGYIPPRLVRVRIQRTPPNQDRIVFDVTPGVGAGRW